ncbi:hypothetical protein OGAPHI_001660 [Ogataea philodendri]|uniref:Uncharacterized protein n=1 Tax=Ogataea philodendri TaxID=1378263 RepID=A0A9P8T821_9ASCO|nr:uncharacterized protein OGAPHI_001660 [Ogataea philodendri]KAH3669064.1 hypothetical protein OGAPHI_001660 [Ogataea philodendri]
MSSDLSTLLENLKTMQIMYRPAVVSRLGLRHLTRSLTTQQLANRVPGDRYYEIKDTVDEYLYYKSLTPRIRELVYNNRNPPKSINQFPLDLEGRPLVPRKVPTTPSVRRFAFFIDGLLVRAELDDVLAMIPKLDQHAPSLLETSVILSLLYKAAEFKCLSETLRLIYSTNAYKNRLKTESVISESIVLLRAMEIEQLGITDVDWFLRKTRTARHNASFKTTTLETAIIAQLSAMINLQRAQIAAGGQSEERVNTFADRLLERLAGFSGFQIVDYHKSNRISMYYGLENTYTLAKYLENCVSKAPELPQTPKYAELVEKNREFILAAEKLQQEIGKKTTLLESLGKIKFEAKKPQPSEPEPKQEQAADRQNPQVDTMEEDDDDLSDSQSEVVEKKKNRRPKENAFTQQKLKAYHPILTPKTVIPLLLVIAIIFIPIGGGMLYGSHSVQEFVIDYSNCKILANDEYFTEIPEQLYKFQFKNEITVKPQWKLATNDSYIWNGFDEERDICQVQFQIPNDIGPHVYFFYRLKNFWANHRRYAKSFSEDQLNGKVASISDIKDTVGQNCEPLSINADGTRYYPCGLIANSYFNDTFSTFTAVNDTNTDYMLYRENIAWSTNKNRFKKTKYSPSEVVPPPNWHKMYPDGYNETNMPDISQWYEFQNWMQTSALPLFSKMISRNDQDVLHAGTYQVDIGYHFPVTPYKGHKYLYLSTRSVIGGKNSFLGISWIVGGGICFVLSLAFLIVNLVHPRKVGDLSLLSWNKE